MPHSWPCGYGVDCKDVQFTFWINAISEDFGIKPIKPHTSLTSILSLSHTGKTLYVCFFVSLLIFYVLRLTWLGLAGRWNITCLQTTSQSGLVMSQYYIFFTHVPTNEYLHLLIHIFDNILLFKVVLTN